MCGLFILCIYVRLCMWVWATLSNKHKRTSPRVAVIGLPIFTNFYDCKPIANFRQIIGNRIGKDWQFELSRVGRNSVGNPLQENA